MRLLSNIWVALVAVFAAIVGWLSGQRKEAKEREREHQAIQETEAKINESDKKVASMDDSDIRSALGQWVRKDDD